MIPLQVDLPESSKDRFIAKCEHGHEFTGYPDQPQYKDGTFACPHCMFITINSLLKIKPKGNAYAPRIKRINPVLAQITKCLMAAPLKTREILNHLAASGTPMPGKSPISNLCAYLNNYSGLFAKNENTKKWALKNHEYLE